MLVPLVLAILAAPAAALAGSLRPAFAAPVGAGFAGLAAVATLVSWLSGGGAVDVSWAPSFDLRFTVELDGLAALYSMLATGIGFLVLVYSSRYLPLHLEHEREATGTLDPGVRFYFFILLFMGSMVGLAMAQDLILVFVFWDLTAIASYYLIGFDRHKEESRASALMALLVTGITAVLLLIGALVFYAAYGTFSIPELVELTEPGALVTLAGGLIAVAGLAKSAQVPFQFWLPRAMAAPTPVSAYLHSAAMVAAGVLLIGRVYPLLQKSEVLLNALLVIGLLSIVVGGVIALTRTVMKQLLAYSTISQYGYVVFMFGLGGEYGAMAASFYVIAHALSKSALFLTAGAVTEATHETEISRIGGLARRMPLLAAASGAAAAGLAALPLTIGFFKDELLFEAALERGALFAGLALLAAVLTLAYTWRFWSGVFLGEARGHVERIPWALVAPVVVLGSLVLVGGLLVEPFAALGRDAGAASFDAPVGVQPAYHLEASTPNLLALATYAIGVLVVLSQPIWAGAARAFARAGELVGPERAYNLSLHNLNRFSDFIHTVEIRDLRGRVASILVPGGILVGLGILATPSGDVYRVGEITGDDIPLILALAAAAIATVAIIFTKKHITLVLVLSSAGFATAVAFAFFGAPDVALVAVLIETIITLLVLGTLKLIPRKVLESGARIPVRQVWRKGSVAAVAAAATFVVSWGTLSQPSVAEGGAADRLTELAPEAHANDVVTVILADFRALDTIGEVTVVALVLLGVATLLFRGRLP